MKDPIVDQLRTFSLNMHQHLLEGCCVIFTVNFLLGRTDLLINHSFTVQKHHLLDLLNQFLLPNFLMFLFPFSAKSHFHVSVWDCSGESIIH